MAWEIDNNEVENVVQIKVIGVGGGGGNAVNRMIERGIQGAEFIAVNTDKQVLSKSQATHKIQIGEKTTHGQGAGGDSETGAAAAEESRQVLEEALANTDMVFITTGMGGGTGTGAAPIIAEIAKKKDILTIGVVTKPFNWEGKRRMKLALDGIDKLVKNVDSLIVIPNQKLLLGGNKTTQAVNAFATADEVLLQGVKSISELITVPGFINLDFADIKSVMENAGYAHMGVGTAKGKDKATVAAKQAISSPLLETSIAGAKGIIISFVASEDIDIEEIEAAAEIITNSAAEDANITWGIVFNPELDDELVITVIATGFDNIGNDPKSATTNPFYTASKATPVDFKATAPAKKSAAPAGPSIPTFDPSSEVSSSSAAEPQIPQSGNTSASGDAFDEDEFYSLINNLIPKDDK